MSETTTTTSSNIVRNVVDSIKDSDSLLQGLLAYFTNLEPIHYITFTINLLNPDLWQANHQSSKCTHC